MAAVEHERGDEAEPEARGGGGLNLAEAAAGAAGLG